MKSYDFFMKADVEPFTDEWIAIIDDNVISHGKSVKAVLKEAEVKAKGKRFLVTFVPGEETMI